MMRLPPVAVLLGGLLLGLVVSPGEAVASDLDCVELRCATVVPRARRFVPVTGAPYLVAYDDKDEIIGWVVRSTDVVNVSAYSGKPLVTLVGIDLKGVISGVRLLEHSEPILLVGIPEKALLDFVAFYPGKSAMSRIVVGQSSDKDTLSVDMISGATVTSLAQNQTILKSARAVGVAVGVIDIASASPGHFVVEQAPWSWQKMIDAGVFGRLTVTETQMHVPQPEGNFIDLWFTIADAPQVGGSLLGKTTYDHLMAKIERGQHLFVVLGNGSSSFKGSAFVRGGIFDRVRVSQGLRELVFRDTDYHSLSNVSSVGAPEFKEGAVFISRGTQIDPGAEFELVFLGSRYNRKGAFSRDFVEFRGKHTLPRTVYQVEKSDLDEAMWVQAWRVRRNGIIFLVAFLVFVMGIFAGRRWTTARPERIKRLHIFVMIVSFFVLGIYMQAQPSVTQLLTLVGSVAHGWRWELFASAPYVFVFWLFIFVVSLIWGRGVFCGWVCPYGSASELINKIAVRLGVPQLSVPKVFRYLRYAILLGLVVVYLQSAVLGEKLAEIEPFKTSFFVTPWTRHWGFFGWFLMLALASFVMWRPFCRYLCPLGAGLAIFNNFRLSGPRRRVFCSSCTICAKGCEPEAIRPDGTIDPRECLSCMDCEASYRNEAQCPPLVGIERLLQKVDRSDRDDVKLQQLRQDKRDV